jgi:hypothetical protein
MIPCFSAPEGIKACSDTNSSESRNSRKQIASQLRDTSTEIKPSWAPGL